jgi:hypothetical protein
LKARRIHLQGLEDEVQHVGPAFSRKVSSGDEAQRRASRLSANSSNS